MKKLISLMATAIFLCTALAVTSFAATQGMCGDGLTYTLDSDGVLTISGTGNMTNYTYHSYYDSSSSPWYSNVKSVIIEEGVKTIGIYAFYKCSNITSVTIPDSVTRIGGAAFDGCSNLERIYITDLEAWCNMEYYGGVKNPLYYAEELYLNGELVTDLVIPEGVTSINDYAFYGCSSITSVTIPNSVTSIGESAFYGCTNLTSITIPESVTSISTSAFYNCSKLATITISDSVTSIGKEAFLYTAYYNDSSNWENNVLYIGNHLIKAKTGVSIPYTIKSGTKTIADYAFYCYSYSLGDIVIPESVISIGSYAFYDCYIKNLTISEGVKSIGSYAFYDSSVESVTIPDSVTSIGDHAFRNCSSLTSVTIGNNVESIGDYAFNNCYYLTTVTIGNNVESIGDYAFNSCSKLASIIIGDGVKNIGEGAFDGTSYYKDSSNWENGVLYIGDYLIKAEASISGSYTIKNGTKCIGNGAFQRCTSLTNVTIPDSVTSIGDSAFYYCRKLTNVTIPDSVTYIGDSAFCYCESFTSITIPEGITDIAPYTFKECFYLERVTIPDSVTSIGYAAFSSCVTLTSVNIPDRVTSIGGYAFSSCAKLAAITIPNGVTTIGEDAFSSCSSLTSVTIPDSVTSIGSYAFSSCKSLTSVTIPDSVTSIGSWAFSSCKSLTSVTIPDSVTSIGEGAFKDCTYLKNVTFGNSLLTIGSSAFYNCTSLTSVTIPDSVTSIGNSAFYNCTYLKNVTFGTNLLTIGDGAFLNCSSLADVTFPESLKGIGDSAFYNCYGFDIVIIPYNVISIGDRSFDCASIRSITFENSETTIGYYALGYYTDSKGNVYAIDIEIRGYKGSTAESYVNSHYELKFVDISLASITVTPPTVTEYIIGDTLDTSGMTVTAYHNDGSVKDVTDKATVDVTTLDRVGTVTVTVTYKDVTDTFDVTVKPKLIGISLTPPTKTEYAVGDTLDVSGMVVTAHYSDGSTKDVTSDAVVEDIELGLPMDLQIRVSYNGHEDSFKVTVFTTLGEENGIKWSIDGYGKLIISGEGDMPDYITSFAPWDNYRDSIKSVEISEKITYVGAYAFLNCSNLETVTIPSTVTKIGEYAFSACFELKGISFPEGMTNIGAYAFSNCSGMTYANIPMSMVKIGTKAFTGCTNIVFTVYEGTYGYDYAVQNKFKYTAIPIPRELIASGEINGIIWEVDNYGVLTVKGEGAIPDYTRSATAPWTEYSKKITSIVVENGVTSIGNYAFYNLSKATSLSIANTVRYIGIQFIRGTGITELYVNVHTIESNAFGRADNLKTLTFGEGFQNAKGNIFYSETLTVKAPVNSYGYKYIEFYNSKYNSGESIAITLESDGTTAKTQIARFGAIGDNTFYAMYWNSKGTAWKMVVSGMGNMKNYPYFSEKNKAKGYTFCPTYYLSEEGLETKILTIEVLEGVTSIGNYAFYKCTKATSVTLPDGITSIGQGAFRACSKLMSVSIPEGVTKLEANAFNGCTALTSLNIPDSVTELGVDIFVKCNTDNMTVKTSNSTAYRYIVTNYPRITIEK